METLARLSFTVPANAVGDFAADYERRLVPVLRDHGLGPAGEPTRAAVDGVHSTLFEIDSPGEVLKWRFALERDAKWSEELRQLGEGLGVDSGNRELPWSLHLYRAPAGPGRATVTGAGERRGAWHTFSGEDGLPNPIVNDIRRDRDGDLWLATLGGVVRFDGAVMTVFRHDDGLLNDRVEAIHQDRDGAIWFGTRDGVSRYDGAEFTSFTAADGLGAGRVRCIFEDTHGCLWFSCRDGGLTRFDGQEMSTYTEDDGLPTNNVICIGEDGSAQLWIGTQNNLCRFAGQTFETLTMADGLPGREVLALHRDRSGVLWVACGEYTSQEGGVARLQDGRLEPVALAENAAHNGVICIFEDSSGNLWFGKEFSGVTCFDGVDCRDFTVDDGLANNQVLSIGEDRAGGLWLGTYGSGVAWYDREQFTTVTTQDGLVSNGVLSMAQDRSGDMWFGTFEDLCRHDGERFTTYTTRDGLAGTEIDAIYEDRSGCLWFGTRHGATRFDGRSFESIVAADGGRRDAVWALCEDSQGHVWLGGAMRREGATRWGEGQWTDFSTAEGLANNSVMGILEDRHGLLWFATEGGISRYDGTTFTTLTEKDGIASDQLTSVLEDRAGVLWFGSMGGLTRYDGDRFTAFTVDDGLVQNNVECLSQDSRGHLWLGTYGGGISRYDGLVFQSLTRRDGLAHDTVQSILEDGDGDIWIATEGGVTRYRPNHTPPTVRIAGIRADRRYDPAAELQIPATQGLVVFEFQGASFTTRPGSMVYAYRLHGHDEGWRTTRNRRAEYEGLAEGEYLFEVKAVDRDLNHSEPDAVRLTVRPDPRIEAMNAALVEGGSAGEFIGESQALQRAMAQLGEVATTPMTVCIFGETGTGKGLAARTVHFSSPRRSRPFIPVNCGAIPESLMESELFGHERGAFTGAVARKVGKVELADGGTLFLDEVGDLPLEAQVKLLRFLDERAFERVGGTTVLSPDVRIIAATNRDLQAMVRDGGFREDLYYRLHGFPVTLPPLRERRQDIPLLAAYFLESMAAHLNKGVARISDSALGALQDYGWPGNVRELEHCVQRAVIVCQGEEIRRRDVSLGAGDPVEATAEFVTLETLERDYVTRVLESCGWAVGGRRGAAGILGLNVSTLRGRMRKLGIRRPGS